MNGLANKLFQFIFQQVVQQNFIKGYRMYIGGAIAIAGGLSGIAEMLVSGNYDETKMTVSWGFLYLGYKTLGEAGKQDAKIEAIRQSTPAGTV